MYSFLNVNGSQLAKMKKSIPELCPCHEIYRDIAVGLLKVANNILEKLRSPMVNMWNPGAISQKTTFPPDFLSMKFAYHHMYRIIKILLHMSDTYNCDYLQHSKLYRFNLIDFQLNNRFPFPILRFFYRKIT